MNSTAAVAGETEADLAYALIFGSIVVLALPLNAVSLFVLLRRHSLKLPSVVFMVNLAISDLLLVMSLPLRVYFYATGIWPLNTAVCIVVLALFRDNIRSSSIFITFISVDRLLAVVYPLRSRCLRTSSNAWKAVTVVWLFVLGMNVPELMNLKKQPDNETVCFSYKPPPNSNKPPVAYYQPVLVVSMLSVNIVCTVMVIWTLHTHLSDPASAKNKVNAMLIFGLNLVMFTICFLPVSIGILTLSLPELKPLVCLATVNCCLDPLLYYFSFDGFWKKKEVVETAQEL